MILPCAGEYLYGKNMTFHFAYPNVLPRSGVYVGCGRYTVFSKGETPLAGYDEVLDAPMTPNRNLLVRAVQLLGAEGYQAGNRLFHIQDQTEYIYQGDSLDLAWLLAQVYCSRKNYCCAESDIWCTGILGLDNDGVHLLGVNHDGFCLKLKAFLNSANRDKLFIVPLVNMNSQTLALCEEAGVEVCQLGKCSKGVLKSKQKQVLAIPANGMTKLLELLFGGKVTKRAVLGGLLFFAVISVVLWLAYPFLVTLSVDEEIEGRQQKENSIGSEVLPIFSPEEIIVAVRKGNFLPLQDFLNHRVLDKDLPEKKLQFQQQIKSPLVVDVVMHYQLANGNVESVVLKDNASLPLLTSQDYYRFSINVKTSLEKLWVYIVQIDSQGKTTVLFPNAALGYENPLSIREWPLQIPKERNHWLVLDKLPQDKNEQMEENLYVLLSPWLAGDLEKLFSSTTWEQGKGVTEDDFLQHFKKRENVNIPSIYAYRWSFPHGKAEQK